MFKLFRKKDIDYNIYSPVNGKQIALEEVNDKVFASKMMGEGVAFQNIDGVVIAPCDGEIVMVPDSKHAVGMKALCGIELLLHIGLDTVKLKGEGFEVLVKVGDRISKGDSLVKVDLEFMNSKGIDLTTPMIITDADDKGITVIGNDSVRKGENIVIEVEK
ncbi:PTS sugar transporter subunit IIA [Breznakia pachnodae]|uniref:Glucose-specific phosphotransferase system IIA component n=1 Tax=Breznakia pachnodae TaxID=265178 RepID=A0ABU0E685_9FIRM|nr:PTS glucose transporter subunit IIA [Breznakia pachnodae]MDQ0362418.1 glucose-specific phosphotransferase system IIA component [Breznakia pachnodae]